MGRVEKFGRVVQTALSLGVLTWRIGTIPEMAKLIGSGSHTVAFFSILDLLGS